MAIEHVKGGGLAEMSRRFVSLGRLRGAQSDQGGYYLDFGGHRVALSSRDAVLVAKAMLASQGVVIDLDPSQFRGDNGR